MRRLFPALLSLLAACAAVGPSPALAQTPELRQHETSDTGAGIRVRWPRPAADSVQTKQSGCYRTKVNGQPWGAWSCLYVTEPRQAVLRPSEPPPVDSTPEPPPVDSQPTPPDTVPPPPIDSTPAPPDTVPTPPPDTTPTPPPAGRHPHEPAGFQVIADNDFTMPLAKSWKGMAGQAGCWETNGGTVIQGGKYQVTYNPGFADGRTPATLHAMTTCQAPKAFTAVYVHLQGYVPGDLGTPMWNNGEGNKILFWHFATGPGTPVLKCWDYVAGSIGGVRSDCSLNLDAQGSWLGARSARLVAGKANDLECLLTLNTPGVADGSATCWVNGQAVQWTRALFRTTAVGISELWLDWTYGGGGAGVAVGQRSIWTLDGFYASGR